MVERRTNLGLVTFLFSNSFRLLTRESWFDSNLPRHYGSVAQLAERVL